MSGHISYKQLIIQEKWNGEGGKNTTTNYFFFFFKSQYTSNEFTHFHFKTIAKSLTIKMQNQTRWKWASYNIIVSLNQNN